MLNKTMVLGFLALAMTAAAARANVFSLGGGNTSLQFVPVGDAGNVADPATGSLYGAVPYNYNIGKYDVTLAQYTAFLNAVAATDTYGCYNSDMTGAGGFGSFYAFGISQSGSSGNYSYSVTGSNPQAPNMPVFSETWGDAARFCNWLQNGQGTAANVGQAYALTETGAYALNGGTSSAALSAVASPAHSGSGAAQYFLPTENDWYKAAYYASGGTAASYWTFPTQSNTAPGNSLALALSTSNEANFKNGNYTDPTNLLTPVGTFVASPGAYGTYDMGGDILQWNETNIGGSSRGLRGGSFSDSSIDMASFSSLDFDPTGEFSDVGFRVASSEAVPEPGSIALLLAGVFGLLAFVWRRRTHYALDY